MKKFKIVVIGATGNVGRLLVSLLEDKEYLIESLRLFASEKSIGKEINFKRKTLKIENISNIDFEDFEVVFFCTNKKIVEEHYQNAVKNSCIIIDKSSFFRSDLNVPLIIPEINFKMTSDALLHGSIISNPNCCVIILAVVLFPLHTKFKIKRLVISTYQSVSGAGASAMEELFDQTRAKIGFSEINIEKFPFQIAFNLIPFIGNINNNGDSEEESKIKFEIKRIISQNIAISVTAVRVPVFISHSMSVNIEFENNVHNVESIKNVLSNIKGVEFMDTDMNAKEKCDCTPIYASSKEDVIVSRLRLDDSQNNTFNLWISGDNLRKGAALNSVQILEKISQLL